MTTHTRFFKTSQIIIAILHLQLKRRGTPGEDLNHPKNEIESKNPKEETSTEVQIQDSSST